MKRTLKFWILVVVAALFCAGCSTKDSSSGQGQDEATKPPPQVRTELLPTLTALPETPIEEITSTPEVAAPAQIYIAPPEDEYVISDDIEAQINELERDIKNLDTSLK